MQSLPQAFGCILIGVINESFSESTRVDLSAAIQRRDSSIVLMLIHQCVAYVIYVGPVFFMVRTCNDFLGTTNLCGMACG